MCHLDCFKCLGNRSDLVELDKNTVAAAELDSLAKPLGVGNKEVISDKLNLIAKLLGQLLPAFPILLIQSILDGNDRIFFNKLLPVCDQLLGSKLCACLRQNVLALGRSLPLAGCGIHCDHEVLARLVACILDCL